MFNNPVYQCPNCETVITEKQYKQRISLYCVGIDRECVGKDCRLTVDCYSYLPVEENKKKKETI